MTHKRFVPMLANLSSVKIFSIFSQNKEIWTVLKVVIWGFGHFWILVEVTLDSPPASTGHKAVLTGLNPQTTGIYNKLNIAGCSDCTVCQPVARGLKPVWLNRSTVESYADILRCINFARRENLGLKFS